MRDYMRELKCHMRVRRLTGVVKGQRMKERVTVQQRQGVGRNLTPDDPFLIEEVIDDFDTVAHLDLCLF